MVTRLLNHRITAAIIFHYVLHGFQVGRGVVTTTLEPKLFQQLRDMKEAVLFEIFLDIQKAYDSLD